MGRLGASTVRRMLAHRTESEIGHTASPDFVRFSEPEIATPKEFRLKHPVIAVMNSGDLSQRRGDRANNTPAHPSGGSRARSVELACVEVKRWARTTWMQKRCD